MSEERWSAVEHRERRSDFVYAVRTTGVFCVPSCAARRPRRANVEFFDDAGAAVAAGYRPCRRCRPTGDDPSRAIVESLRAALDADPSLALSALGRLVGLSPSRVQRIFLEGTGLSPREYVRAQRQRRVESSLRDDGRAVTDAAFDAGYGSLRGFYDQTALGMPPSAVKHNGQGHTVRYTVIRTRFGHVALAATERGVCAARFGDSDAELAADLQRDFASADVLRVDDELRPLAEAFVRCLDDDRHRDAVPLDVAATAFQQRVWDALRTIPRGETRTYGEIAAMIGKPGAARAVGAACGANPVAIVVPCHRSIARGGAMQGYRWGVERKRALLEYEADPLR